MSFYFGKVVSMLLNKIGLVITGEPKFHAGYYGCMNQEIFGRVAITAGTGWAHLLKASSCQNNKTLVDYYSSFWPLLMLISTVVAHCTVNLGRKR